MKKITRTTAEWVEIAKTKHGDVYDYATVDYRGTHSRVNIVCPVHGPFLQLAYKHLAGAGCSKCGRLAVGNKQRKTTEELINQARSVHGTAYDYSLVTEYKHPDQKISIGCALHGAFLQCARDHLRGAGCPRCSRRVSLPEQRWLDSLGILKENRQVWIRLADVSFQVDGFDPITNTVYEFWGDYWHGNPQVYGKNEVNATNGIRFGDLYTRTVDKRNMLVDNGFKVVEMWEREWRLTNGCAARGK